MDSRIPNNNVRADVVTVESTARPTPTPVRVPFSQVLAAGAGALVNGAQAAVNVIPGAPVMALSVRGGAAPGLAAPITPGLGVGGVSVNPEGPGGVGVGGGISGTGITIGGAGVGGTDGVAQSLQQAQEMNLYYLQIQQEVDAENRQFSTYSNVLKAEHDTVKTAIGNIRT
jgi:hypothetical protein